MPITIETCVARHTGDRKEQQDRVALFPHPTRPGTMMAVLADGMGGHSGGSMAAEQVLLKAQQNFDAFKPASETAGDLLGSIVTEAHVIIRLTRYTTEKDPHSTVAALLLQPDRVDWVHCGDSRIYHFRGDTVVSRSIDHSVVGELQRRGRLDSVAAMNHPQHNVLLSCVGSEREPSMSFGEAAPLTAGDSFLLCSDGLWSCIPDEELARTVASMPARDAAGVLIREARERAGGNGDNISLSIIKLVAG